jgi:hypothetical protein
MGARFLAGRGGMRHVGLIAAAVGLLIPLSLLAFRLLPRPVVRLDVIAPSSVVMDRDGDVRLDLALHEGGTADLRAVVLSKAELSWSGGSAALEALRDVSHLQAGEGLAFPLMTVDPIRWNGDTEAAVLKLDLVWISEDTFVGDGSVGGSSWSLPLQLRR